MDFRENDLPDECAQMVVTSPPYWGLRKYSGEQEIPDWGCAYGIEKTPELYVQHTVEILRDIRRVLRKDGVVFWNIGDSYYASGGAGGDYNKGGLKEGQPKYRQGNGKTSLNLKPKDLCLIPFRVAIAAQEDGWWVRSDIIWSKPNPMPESVTDRPTNSHEYILMFTKSAKYYWDADAVREQCLEPERSGKKENMWSPNVPNDEQLVKGGYGRGKYTHRIYNPAGRNIRSVWEFPTQPYPEAHFAVFPEKLPETCIKAATPEVGCCSKCGAPWERIIGKGFAAHDGKTNSKSDPRDKSNNGAYGRLALLRQAARERGFEYVNSNKTIGWQPTCKCDADKVPSIVLDPFAGSGTTLWVAKKLGRKAIGFDTSEEYCGLNRKRNMQQALELVL